MFVAGSRTNRNELVLISLLCLAAALRVFIFSAAFPFFSNIDEDLHFDLITQYSHAQVPRSFDRLKEETLNWIVPYASPEFLSPPERFPDAKFPPPLWKESWSKVEPEIAATRAAWSSEMNFESSQPPLYYALAGMWWWIGKQIGLVGIESLYWIRFLNVALMSIVVWLGYVAARTIAPERLEVRLGVPLLLAFIPQNVFYAINNDVLSPLCFGLLFLCVLQWLRTDAPSFLLGAITGAAIASTYLTKLSNLPLIIIAVAVILASLARIVRRSRRAGLIPLAALFFCAAVPVCSWMVWLKLQFGDVTGSTAKIVFLDWTRKPFLEWWQHPIFSPHGLWFFWSDLIATFWRGEVEWHGKRFDWQIADWLYAISSLVFIAAAVVGLRKPFALSGFQRQAIAVAILIFAAGVAFLGLLSIQFDFGSCVNPSRSHPYFTSGRLLSGAMIPFALSYVYGVSCLCRLATSRLRQTRWIETASPLIVLGAIVVFSQASEIVITHPVFASEHNWFHR
ncbi:MAG TPA: DUF2142 domain-containing protein [Candidatus Udaeobacter sp.]